MSWLRPLATLVLALSTLACGREAETKAETKTDAKASSSTPEVESAQACAVLGQEIERTLLDACSISDQVLTVDVPFAPWKATPSSAPSDALSLELSREGVVVGWGPPMPLRELESRLSAEREHARGALSWVLAIDGATPRKDVAAVLETLANSGLTQGSLQLGTTSVGTIPKPRDPKRLADLHARMPADEPSQRATFLAKEIEEAMPPCPGARKAFEAVAVAAPEQRCELLARGIAAGLVGCGCPKVDEMMTLVYAVAVGTEVPTRLGLVVPVTLDPKSKPRAGATWADIVAGMSEGTLTALWVSRR